MVGQVDLAATLNNYIQFTGVQLEAGAVSTAFQTYSGTLQGELAACQRYYYRVQGKSGAVQLGMAMARSTSAAYSLWQFPVTMRTSPTVTASNVSGSAAFKTSLAGNDYTSDTTSTFATGSEINWMLNLSGVSGATAGWAGWASIDAGKTTSYIEASAEL
jgi:hypothetical protein